MNWDHSVIFETAPKYCISDSFADYEGYSTPSKGFLLTVVDTMVFWIKFTHYSSLNPKMSTFTLGISCLIKSILPWFMDLTFQVAMQCFSLQHWTLLSPPDTSTPGHHLNFGSASSFFLELFLCSSPIAYWRTTSLGGLIFQYHTFLPFQSSWGSQGKNTEVAYHSLLQEMTISQAMTSRDMLFSHSRSVSIPVPKKGNDKECSNHHTTALISMPAR